MTATLAIDSGGAGAIDRALAGERLSRQDLLGLYERPYEELAAAAHELRLARTDPGLVTYSVYGNIDYTNVCIVGCDFCCYYRSRVDRDAFTLTHEQILDQIASMRDNAVDNVLLMGGINPQLPFAWYTDLLQGIKEVNPRIWIDAFSPEEIFGLERLTGRDAGAILAELGAAGMDALPGVSAEILIDSVRHRVARKRIPSADWFRIVEAAFAAGLEVPCASMVFGLGENAAQRVEHLVSIREFQDRVLTTYGRGIQSFEVWPMRVKHTRAGRSLPVPDSDEIATEYLRHLAVGRFAVDNIDHHRTVWRTMGFGIAGQGLRSGADELSGTGTINAITAVTRADGRETPGIDEREQVLADIRGCITGAGFTPARRDPHWQIIGLDPAPERDLVASR